MAGVPRTPMERPARKWSFTGLSHWRLSMVSPALAAVMASRGSSAHHTETISGKDLALMAG